MIALLLLWGSVASLAAPQLVLSTTTAELGRPVDAVAKAPASFAPDLQASTTDAYAISLAGEPSPGKGSEADLKIWPLKILPLAVGKLTVGLVWNEKSGSVVSKADLEATEPALPADADVADIKRPAKARPLIWPWLLAAALLAGAYYAWTRWRRRTVAAAPSEPPDARTPAQRALDELGALEGSSLWSDRRFADFYFHLTEILRGYLERRDAIPALKMTTYELTRHLRRHDIDRQALAAFRDLFDRADLVKFAKTTPEPEQGGLDLAAARRFIEAAAPHDSVKAAGAAP